jgi:hypothetical protein
MVHRAKINRRIFFACSALVASLSHAQGSKISDTYLDTSYQFMASDGASLVRSAQKKMPGILHTQLDDEVSTDRRVVMINSAAPNTALSVALARAWKRDFIEEGVEETRKMLLDCQRETSVLLTIPFMRSDGQQAHCFRF